MTTETNMRNTYSITEVAAMLGVSERHAYNAARDGRLPGVIRIGKRWLMPRAAMARLLGEEPQA